MTAAVASSWGRPQSAMSPAPTNTGSAPGLVLKVQVGPVVVRLPSLTVTYHSNFWPSARLDQMACRWCPRRRRVLGDLGEDAARERAAEVGHRQRVVVGIGDADVEGRRGADPGGAVGRCVERRDAGAKLPGGGGTKPGTQAAAADGRTVDLVALEPSPTSSRCRFIRGPSGHRPVPERDLGILGGLDLGLGAADVPDPHLVEHALRRNRQWSTVVGGHGRRRAARWI